DRLDAAFAAKHSAADAAITSPGAATPAADIDWFSAANGGAASMDSWDLPAPPAAETPFDPPLTFASPEPPPVSFEAPPPLETAAPFEPPVAVEPPPIEFASPSEVAEFQEAAAFEQPPARDYGDVSHLFETAPQVTAPAASEAAVAPAPPVPSPKQSDPLQEFPAAVEFATAGAAVAPPAPKPSAPPPQLQPAAVSLPPLSDAFAALLAAEAAIGSRQAAIAWPATPPPSAAISDELIEAVARRVLDRLSDRVMRDAVAETVSRIAEQLVRDEIERIKASINK
ncbi:MAG TPA: hypothetical protein VKD69_18295, partial [Vicinamibacterales bacterium]|nr:hypothetical protein [Vicinamibacterales bacterium]